MLCCVVFISAVLSSVLRVLLACLLLLLLLLLLLQCHTRQYLGIARLYLGHFTQRLAYMLDCRQCWLAHSLIFISWLCSGTESYFRSLAIRVSFQYFIFWRFAVLSLICAVYTFLRTVPQHEQVIIIQQQIYSNAPRIPPGRFARPIGTRHVPMFLPPFPSPSRFF